MLKVLETPQNIPGRSQILDPEEDLKPEDIPAAKQILSNYQEQLHEMEQGAQKEICTLPFYSLPEGEIPYSMVSEYDYQRSNSVSKGEILNMEKVVVMMKIMLLRARLASLENRPEDAVKDFELVLQYGRHFNQGELIDRLISMSIQKTTLKNINKLLSSPAAGTYAELIHNSLDKYSEPLVFDKKDIARYEVSLRLPDITGMNLAIKTILEKISKISLESTQLRYDEVNAYYGISRLGTAVRIYQAAHNQEFPPSLKELALSQSPVDPFTQKDYLYTVSENKDTATLSSPGPDLKSVGQDEQKQALKIQKELVLTLQK